MHTFYTPNISGEQANLSETESKHAVQVLRLKSGETIELLDGRGGRYQAVIEDPHPKKCSVKIIDKKIINAGSIHLHIAIAPTKMNDRFEWFLEKATEIGVEEITPLLCHRSERKTINHERFEKVIVSAMKQSMRSWLPVLNPLTSFNDFLNITEPGFIAHCDEGEKFSLQKELAHKKKVLVLIGPEGDFSPDEISKAILKKWKPISLGETRLRTETAGVMVCASMAVINR